MEAVLRARLRRWFTTSGTSVSGNEDIDLSLAALLVELMRADYEEAPHEYEAIRDMLARRFNLDEQAAEQLLEQGERAADRAVSLFRHTRALDVGLDEREKFDVVETLWRIALSDDRIAGEEDYLVHKIGDLLHVSHPHIMRLKDKVMRAHADQTEEQGQASS